MWRINGTGVINRSNLLRINIESELCSVCAERNMVPGIKWERRRTCRPSVVIAQAHDSRRIKVSAYGIASDDQFELTEDAAGNSTKLEVAFLIPEYHHVRLSGGRWDIHPSRARDGNAGFGVVACEQRGLAIEDSGIRDYAMA